MNVLFFHIDRHLVLPLFEVKNLTGNPRPRGKQAPRHRRFFGCLTRGAASASLGRCWMSAERLF